MGSKQKLIIDSSNCTPTWMVTLGDTMSLLLCFFVLLLTFSDINPDELTNILGFFSGSFGVISRKSRMHPSHLEGKNASGGDLSPVVLRFSDIPARLYEVRRKLAAQGFRQHVTIEQLAYGLRIRVSDAVLFDAQGGISAKGENILREVINLFNGVDNEIRLTAMTDTGEATLASACRKNTAVADYLIDKGGLQRRRFGFGTQFSTPGVLQGTFAIDLMENAEAEHLSFADLWRREGWRR